MITQISYNVLIERFRAFASGHYLIEAFTHGELSQTDLEKDQRFPWMHVFPVEVEPRSGSRLYTFVVTFADLPRDKETDAEYQRESLSDCIKLAEDLLAEIQNGLTLFGPTVELEGSATIEPFIKEFTHTLTGVNLTLTISVPWNWDACDIPADFTVGGSGSGGSGSGGGGILLETNGVVNGDQTLLNLQQGENITIIDNGFGTVTISGTGTGAGGTVTSVALTAPNAFSVSGSPITGAGTLGLSAIGDATEYIDGEGNLQTFPTIPAAQVPSDWAATTGVTRILNKPTIPTTLDSLTDVNAPTPSNGQVLTWNGTAWVNNTPATGGTVTSVALTVPTAFSVTGSPITTAGTLAISAVGTISQYIRGNGTLATFPTIPAAQIQSDWAQTNNAALDYIKNKPTIPAAQVNSDWSAVSGVAQILNKPTIPTTLDSLTNVNAPSPSNAQVLQYDTASSQWIAATPSTGGTVTSVALTMPSAFTVGGSPVTTAGTLAVTGAGTTSQYVRGDGTLANFPSTGGGGGQIFYFNGNASQGTISGNAFFQLGTAANTGPAANFTRATTGVIARFITDANSPNHLIIPAGVWTIDVYLSETGGGSNHAQIIAVLKVYNGLAFTTIASSPLEEITNGNVPDLYTFTISVPNTVTAATDRVVIEFDIQNTNGKTVTLYTENNKIGEVHSTYAIGLSSLNGLTANTQTFATGTTGTDFGISSAGSVHTFNLPTASASNRGALSSADWSTFNGKLTGNTAITGATKTKVTYDSKGLVTAGADLAASDMPTGIDAANIGSGTVSNTEFGYLDGVTSALQTQINAKQNSIGLTTVGTNLATLPNPSAVRFLKINADNTVTARTAAEMVTDLGITSGFLTLLYQSQNATNIPASSTYFGCLFGGALSIVSADTLRRTPIATGGALTKLYVQTSTAQPATGSLVCTVRKNSVDQSLTLTIAAGSAAGVFTDLVNSVTVAAGDLLGMKFQNNATGVSANVLSNQVQLSA